MMGSDIMIKLFGPNDNRKSPPFDKYLRAQSSLSCLIGGLWKLCCLDVDSALNSVQNALSTSVELMMHSQKGW